MAVGGQTAFQQNSYRRLAAYALASLALCLSFVMSFFTPFPVALAAVVYGRKKGYGAVALAWGISLVVSFLVLRDPTFFVSYSASVLVTVAVAETVLRNINPMKGIAISGIALALLAFGAMYAGFQTVDVGIKEYLVNEIEDRKEQFQSEFERQTGAGSNEAFQMLALLEQPEKLAEQVIKEFPGYFVMGVFLTLWANVFLLLKARRLFAGPMALRTERDLIYYKNPDHLIWAVIVALALAVFGEELNPYATAVGMSGLKILGVFYFFQGFGLYISFLDFMRLGGLLRAILVVATVMTASQVLAIFGLFDMFVNFRKFMKRKDT